MKVTISVGGRFHAFYLAQQLIKRGYLKKLITPYPKFEAVKYGIPKDKIDSIIMKELISRGWQALPPFLKNLYNPQYLLHEIYDKQASNLYGESDICTAFSGFALHTIRKAKKAGAVTIVERGSSHMLYQQRILKEECGKAGFKFRPAHPRVVEKELTEYEEADYISIPSLFVKNTFLKFGISERKLIHIPYGVDLSSFRQMPKEDEKFRVIYCGGITMRKGVHYLLQVFHELNLPDSELWLIGSMDEEMLPFLRRFSSDKVVYKGQYPQTELYKYYSQGSVFVIMSIEEGLAMVQPQAMACGLSVICTTNTGGEDIVRDGVDGFVIPAGDVEVLKEKITYMYENRDICKEMGRSARQRVSEGFTWNDYGEKMVKAYEKVLNGK